jgi:hypothetical protein
MPYRHAERPWKVPWQYSSHALCDITCPAGIPPTGHHTHAAVAPAAQVSVLANAGGKADAHGAPCCCLKRCWVSSNTRPRDNGHTSVCSAGMHAAKEAPHTLQCLCTLNRSLQFGSSRKKRQHTLYAKITPVLKGCQARLWPLFHACTRPGIPKPCVPSLLCEGTEQRPAAGHSLHPAYVATQNESKGAQAHHSSSMHLLKAPQPLSVHLLVDSLHMHLNNHSTQADSELLAGLIATRVYARPCTKQ